MIGRPRHGSWSRWIGAVSEAIPGGHLSLDAVVAHVDGELPPGPAARAAAHVDRCPACAGEVMAQRQARRRLRGADAPGVPDSLLCSLRAIPDVADLPEVPAGLTLDAEGRFVVPAEVPEARRRTRTSRSRRLPVVVASGLVAGAAAVVGPVIAAGAVPAVTPAGSAPAGASLTAASPVPAGDHGPVVGAVEHAGPVGAVPALGPPRTSTTPSPTPTTSEHPPA